MPKKRQSKKKPKNNTVELGKETLASVISVQREYTLTIKSVGPKRLDEFYIGVPEVSRAIDLRGAAVIYRGFEIKARNDTDDAKRFANLALGIINKSGGVNFIEQWQKNADLYGDGYVEMVDDNSGKITELAHVHPYLFGYELELYYDEKDFTEKTRIKLDPETQKPVGYATYKYDETKDLIVNNKLIPLERIAHLKYKLIGDALNGISLIAPMTDSILRKLKIEDNIEAASRLVASPKMVIKGDFGSDEDARDQAKEAASLDVNDVVILQDGKEFQFVNPGQTNLPELREIFVTNITTASGIPRPVLTSESAEINKATMRELMRQLRENMRSNMNKIRFLLEHKIFPRIAETYNLPNWQQNVPYFVFPEDVDTEEEIIEREQKKAATITSLANSLSLLNAIMMGGKNVPPNTEMKDETKKAMIDVFSTLDQTIKTFDVNNDQLPGKIEEEPVGEDVDGELKLNLGIFTEENVTTEAMPSKTQVVSVPTDVTLIDDGELMRDHDYIIQRHDMIHTLYELISKGEEVIDFQSEMPITISMLIQKHMQYVRAMQNIGLIHEHHPLGEELDQLLLS